MGLIDDSHELIQHSHDKEIFAKYSTFDMVLMPSKRLMCIYYGFMHGLDLDQSGNDLMVDSDAVIARKTCLREPPFGH